MGGARPRPVWSLVGAGKLAAVAGPALVASGVPFGTNSPFQRTMFSDGIVSMIVGTLGSSEIRSPVMLASTFS